MSLSVRLPQPGRQFTTQSVDLKCIADNSAGMAERFRDIEQDLLKLHPTEEDEDESAQQEPVFTVKGLSTTGSDSKKFF